MSDNNIATLTRFLETIAAGDITSALELVDPACELNEPPGLPYGGTYIGGQGFLQMAASCAGAFELTPKSIQLHDAGDVAIAEMDVSVRSKQTGRSLDTSIVELYRFTGGKISGIDVYHKAPEAVTELTVDVPPAT
ncbi:nuclear transport factor 2 family protein [Nocardia sp. NPDC055029]